MWTKWLSGKAQICLASVTAVLVVAGAGLGVVLSQDIQVKTVVEAKQPVYIDVDNLSAKDVGKAAHRKLVSASKDKTRVSIAAEVSSGDELVIDLPLINMATHDVDMVMDI